MDKKYQKAAAAAWAQAHRHKPKPNIPPEPPTAETSVQVDVVDMATNLIDVDWPRI
jgi:hypothetical protein